MLINGVAGLLTPNWPQCPLHPDCRYLPFQFAGKVARKLAVLPVAGLVTKLPVSWQNAGISPDAATKLVAVLKGPSRTALTVILVPASVEATC